MGGEIMIRGGGDLASGVALRLARIGMRVCITELAQPLAVRRLVSFAEAVYSGEITIEGVLGRKVSGFDEARQRMGTGMVPVLVDPAGEARHALQPLVIVDGRMTKRPPDLDLNSAPLVIGLGPGFLAGVNCHAVVETKRGPFLGRVIWEGPAEPDSGLPEMVADHQADRVLRAPADGVLSSSTQIGEVISAGQEIASVDGRQVCAAFQGVLRGLLHPGIQVRAGTKIGDLDPRADPRLARLVSDKALAIGGGVIEAILSRAELRPSLWPD